ncbi:hypothetical protein M2152_002707 [Microbacteriaceae bacterium SG_E_30_P1]|uniref:DUF3073 domain-containing protein n=1 Tax=Antiquaquibacter oligotrophicus TaxID=2880260 RepID=A0ABT6KRD0_9MICO|nr:DUF3073 domain-containing protein [Antiquaquibacter oligotrophicus]MDH6182525.1 hypothetical protein [Antiquaquibacter oligotrophicus]UDF14506.1 DUF3073 domain-containing protein [Antiquaquibacter oligotrophicus]
MGRGRQKAKHTKVARDLKYFSPNTNYDALERELAASKHSSDESNEWPEYVDTYADEYADSDEDESKTA